MTFTPFNTISYLRLITVFEFQIIIRIKHEPLKKKNCTGRWNERSGRTGLMCSGVNPRLQHDREDTEV